MTLIGGVFRYDCAPDGTCPPAPTGFEGRRPGEILVPLNLWAPTVKELVIDLRATDTGGLDRVALVLHLGGDSTLLDGGGGEIVSDETDERSFRLIWDFDRAPVTAGWSTRVVLRMPESGDFVLISNGARDRAGNLVGEGVTTVEIE